MFDWLKGLVEKKTVIKKKELLELYDTLDKDFRDLIEDCDLIISSVKFIKKEDDEAVKDTLVKSLAIELELDRSRTVKLVSDFKKFLNNKIIEDLPEIKKEIEINFSNIELEDTINIKDSMVFGLLTSLIVAKEYTDYFLMYLIYKNLINKDDFINSSFEKKFINKFNSIIGFYKTINEYSIPKLLELTEDMGNGILLKTDDDILENSLISNIVKRFKSNSSLSDIARGFISDLSYSIMVFFIDIKLAKADELEYKKKLLEAILLDLKYQSENQDSPDLQKKIEVYEKEILALEREIEELRD